MSYVRSSVRWNSAAKRPFASVHRNVAPAVLSVNRIHVTLLVTWYATCPSAKHCTPIFCCQAQVLHVSKVPGHMTKELTASAPSATGKRCVSWSVRCIAGCRSELFQCVRRMVIWAVILTQLLGRRFVVVAKGCWTFSLPHGSVESP